MLYVQILVNKKMNSRVQVSLRFFRNFTGVVTRRSITDDPVLRAYYPFPVHIDAI